MLVLRQWISQGDQLSHFQFFAFDKIEGKYTQIASQVAKNNISKLKHDFCLMTRRSWKNQVISL